MRLAPPFCVALAALAVAGAACDDHDHLDPWIGVWSYAAGTRTIRCPLVSTNVPLTAETPGLVVSSAAHDDLTAWSSWGSCRIPLRLAGATASAPRPVACADDSATLDIETLTLVLTGPRQATLAASGAFTGPPAPRGVTCGFGDSAQLIRSER